MLSYSSQNIKNYHQQQKVKQSSYNDDQQYYINTNNYYFNDYFNPANNGLIIGNDKSNFVQSLSTNDKKQSSSTKKNQPNQTISTMINTSYSSSPYSPFQSSTLTDNVDLIYESLLKAYQSGSLSKSRYRRLIANERERRRMHGLNVAFANLRACLPSLGSNKQFSKYETLQMAKNYISTLEKMLN